APSSTAQTTPAVDTAAPTPPAATAPVSEAPAATATPSAAPTPTAMVHSEKLPRDLSPWGMFQQADMVVKAVMIGLILASIITWTVWLAKSIELAAAKLRLRKALQKLAAANSIGEAAHLVDSKRGAVPAMLRAAIAETRASWDI